MRRLKARLWCKWGYWITKYPLLKRWKHSYREAILADKPVAFYTFDENQANKRAPADSHE
jgi:hypothetical protein